MSENKEQARHDCYLFIHRTEGSTKSEQIVIQGTGKNPEDAKELFDHALKKYKENFDG